MPNDDLQLTEAELAKLQSLQSEVSEQMERKQAAEREQQRRQALKHAIEAEKKRRAEARLALVKAEETEVAPIDDDPEIEDLEPTRQKRGLFARLAVRDAKVSDAIEVATEARQELEQPKEKGKKSLLWSGGLSFVGGPLGWLYAGSLREALPAAVVYLIVASIATKTGLAFMFLPVFAAALAVSGLAGVIYAWQYNRHGKRQRLFGDDKKDEEKKKKKKGKKSKKGKAKQLKS